MYSIAPEDSIRVLQLLSLIVHMCPMCSAVGSMSDCRGREFDPSLVPNLRGDCS